MDSWLRLFWLPQARPATNHRLRQRQLTQGVHRLESRVYLGALPGVEAAIWTSATDSLPTEPAVVELVASSDPVVTATSWNEDTSGEPETSLLSATTSPGPDDEVADPPKIMTDPVDDTLPTLIDPTLLMAMADSAGTAPNERESSADAPSQSIPLTAGDTESMETAEAVPEVFDPNDGGANNGSLPIGTELQQMSSTSAESRQSPPVGFSGADVQGLVRNSEDPLVIRYDFRDEDSFGNVLTAEQQAVVEQAMTDWSAALQGAVRFERDTTAPADEILNFGMGDLALFGYQSAERGTLGLGGGKLTVAEDGTATLSGRIWMDQSENWDNTIGNGNVAGKIDLYTAVTHEIGHALGLEHETPDSASVMAIDYETERTVVDLYNTVILAGLLNDQPFAHPEGYDTTDSPMMADYPQLTAQEVETLLNTASTVTQSEDAIIAIVDRNGRLLGVRCEQEVLNTITDTNTLVFAIDGAIAKARTAAFFANGDPQNTDSFSPNGTATPLTSRLVRFISQSTMTEREVASNPNIQDPDSPLRGPGFVAPIGLGGHFPPEIPHTPPVDLFNIEHTNRDSIVHTGADNIRGEFNGVNDDFLLRSRFNLDPNFIPPGQELFAPESYGFTSGLLPAAQSRGIATLPGGVPLFRDTNGDEIGDTLVGGVGVFFPGVTGDATFEQNFIAGIGQSEDQRTNAPKVLEAEYIAVVTAGGSIVAQKEGAQGAKPFRNTPFDIPFGRLDLVGIQLQVIGPTAGIQGVIDLINFGTNLTDGQFGTFPVSGSAQPLNAGLDNMFNTSDDVLYADGLAVPEGWLVTPHDATDGSLTAADVERIVQQAINGAEVTRSAIRLTADGTNAGPGSRTRMVIAVADTNGEILGLYRMTDSTVFSIDVAVAKARNTAYYADADELQPEDQVPGIEPGVAFSNRTFRFLSEPRYPSGVDGSQPPLFSILNAPGIDPTTGENTGAPLPASVYNGTIVGYDAFNPTTNFHDPGSPDVVAAGGVSQPLANNNGVVFFPGSAPLYKTGGTVLAGGFGISGDGVDQDDVVTFLGSDGYRPDGEVIQRADQVTYLGVRLPFTKFNRNPFG